MEVSVDAMKVRVTEIEKKQRETDNQINDAINELAESQKNARMSTNRERK